MIYLPFIYFFIWMIRSYRKFGISIGSYILSMVTLSSFCAILIDANDLYVSHSCPKVELGFFSPILYLILMTASIFPFYKMGKLSIKSNIPIKVEKWLSYLIFFYFSIFLIVLLVSLTRINEILFYESLREVRNAQYTGEAESFYNDLRGIPRYICAICSILSPTSYIMLLVFGYMMAFSKKSIYLCIIALVSSMTPLLISINIADRSGYFYWMALAGFAVVTFLPHYPSRRKKILFILMGIVFVLAITYFMMVTISRFDERADGTSGGLIMYTGQSYINFCRFFNTLNTPNSIRLFTPSLNSFVFHDGGYFYQASLVSSLNHTPIAVFPTFIGIIYSVCGPFVLLLFFIVYLRYANRISFMCRLCDLSFSQLCKLWTIGVIPVVGIITYFYITTDIPLLLWLCFVVLFRKLQNSYR